MMDTTLSTSRKVLLWIAGLVTVFYGLGALAVPGRINDAFGGTTTDSLVATMRVASSFALAMGVLAFYSLRIEDATARRAVDATLFVAFAVMTITNSWNGYAYGFVNAAFLWSNSIVFGLIAVAFGYYLFGPDMRMTGSGARPIA